MNKEEGMQETEADVMKRKAEYVASQIEAANNVNALGTQASPRLETGFHATFENREIRVVCHEARDAYTLLASIEGKRTAEVTFSAGAACALIGCLEACMEEDMAVARMEEGQREECAEGPNSRTLEPVDSIKHQYA